MRSLVTKRVTVYVLVWAFLSTLAVVSFPQVDADNVVGSPNDISFSAGDSNNELKVKVVSNTAQSQKGDPVPDCNIGVKGDGITVDVTLSISPANGLVATPNPIVFDECNKFKTVTLTSDVGGTYVITASAEDNDPRDGAYHLEPFGEVTVVVIDTTPPETTIDSAPADPTSNTSATFEFSSNEPGSTFECSLDGAGFSLCESGITYTGLEVGTHTFAVRATDQSNNMDTTADTHQWEIRNPSIDITSVSPESALWGVPVEVSGTADVVDLAGLTVTVDWGDGTTDQGIAISGGQWSAPSHTYATSGVITITANLTDGVTVKASTTDSVEMNKHTTALTLFMPPDVTGLTKYLANGTLVDLDAGGAGISGRTIEFDGDGATPDVQTGGPTFIGTLNLVSCDIGPDDCSPDPVPVNETSTSTDNMVLHLGVGGKITFPPTTAQAIVYLQDMDTVDFKYKVIEYTGEAQDCNLGTPEIEEVCAYPPPDLVVTDPDYVPRINTISGYVTDGEVKAYHGIMEIIVTEVAGSSSVGTLGISAIQTSSIDTTPTDQTDQYLINFEDLAPFSSTDPFTISPGSYFAIGVAPELPIVASLEADFAGDDLYEASSATPESYVVKANHNLGLGTSFASSGSGTSVVENACAAGNDSDDDGICDTWENAFSVTLPGIPGAWDFPGGREPINGIPDIYYEIDCMTGFCPTQAELTYIEGRFLAQNINLHLMLDQTGLPVVDGLKVWSDNDGIATNDFRSIKLNNYGTNSERTAAGGDLGDAKPLFILKSQVVRYLLVGNTMGVANGGPSGIAEINGNDAVVTIGAIPVAAADKDEARIGTIMHEIGHNLGLLHGGKDSDNCKPNYVSVMNYNRQMPHTKFPVPGVSATTGVGWYGDYSHGNIVLRNSGGTLLGTGAVNELLLDDTNKLTKSGTWKAFDGTSTINSFKLMWASQTAGVSTVRVANTGAQLDWDGDISSVADVDQPHDLNNLDIIIGAKQLPACGDPDLLHTTLAPGGDDYATIKANIKKFNGGSSALLGLTPASERDANSVAELNVEIYNGYNTEDYEFLGVENPLNNVAFGEEGIATSKKGNTIHVRFNFNDADGTPVTDNNIHLYPIDQPEGIILKVAPVTSGEPPDDDAYFSPATSTQGDNADYFTWDGSKWGFQWGTKTLPLGTYAARIYLVNGDQGVILDHNADGISFLVQIVKN